VEVYFFFAQNIGVSFSSLETTVGPLWIIVFPPFSFFPGKGPLACGKRISMTAMAFFSSLIYFLSRPLTPPDAVGGPPLFLVTNDTFTGQIDH